MSEALQKQRGSGHEGSPHTLSERKKRFTNNTNIRISNKGMIIGISKSTVGSTNDIAQLREDPMPFGKWTKSMKDGSTPKEDRIRLWADKGYQGTDKDLPEANLMIPIKNQKTTGS